MVTALDVLFYAEVGQASGVKALALEAARDGDKALALRLLRSVSRDGVVDSDSLLAWAGELISRKDAECRAWQAEMDAMALMPSLTVSNRPAPNTPEMQMWGFNEEKCQLCGEDPDAEMGEFWDETGGNSVIAHAQCGLDAGLPLA
jgi:hypothetical protein